MPLLAEVVDAVVGIDTHRDVHEAELTAPSGALLAQVQIPNSDAGSARLIAWVRANAPGPDVVAAVEGTRSYGIGLARAFALAQQTDRLPSPRADGIREALRILLSARQEMVTTSTAQTNRLRALLLSGDDVDRDASRSALTHALLSRLARRRLRPDADRPDAVRHQEIRRLACALRDVDLLLKANRRELHELVEQIAPGLIQRPGIGPVSAAQVIVSFSHPGRVRNDAAFAKLAGTSPLPASSGQIVRHRLNRGADRALNKAVHTIALTRMRSCTRTRDYVSRRTAEGKTSREIRRALKRYITRELYRSLNAAMTG